MASKTVGVGLFRGVRDTGEPLDDGSPGLVQDATNVYLPDPESGSGFYARPGITTSQSVTVPTAGAGQGVYAVRALDGTTYNFFAAGGKLWRQPTTLTSAPVDVTPTTVSLASSKFITFTSLAGVLIVNDNVNKPWIGSNLGGTPITATVIEYQTPTVALSIGSNDVRLANAAFTCTFSGTQSTFAANATGTAIGALGQIAANTWGVILVEATNASTLAFTAAFNAGAGYATEALAIAARPARTLGRWYVGYVTVRADAGAVWIAGTDAFAGGSTGNQAQTTNYYAGEGPAWSAYGQPAIYYGAVFFIAQQLAATYARTTILWSEPNLPDEGYQQDGYDNAWTLTQTAADPLYALAATNTVLYYFRQLSIGGVSGAPGVNFQGTATHDLVSGNVGTTAYATVKTFLDFVYFADQNGRPWRLRVGGVPEPIWWQLRSQYDSTLTGFKTPDTQSANAFTVLEPNLNVVLFAVWPQFAFAQGFFLYQWYAFDAVTGVYVGRWFIGATDVSTAIDAGGIAYDASGQSRLLLLGNSGGGTSLPIYYMRVTSDGVWTDNSTVPGLKVQTGWLEYDGLRTARVSQARVLQESSTPQVTVTVTPVAGAAATATATMRMRHTYTGRAIASLNAEVGRGAQFSVSPTTATTQWRVYRVEADFEGAGRATVEDV